VKVVVSTPGVVGRIYGQLGALEPWREVGRPKGLCAVKGDPIPWVVQVVGNKVEPGFWGFCVWRVENQKGRISLWTHSLSSKVVFY
jgi:hypothetical protein